ncbi:MAG: UDP-N-acetylglucosamine--N-acetylmuramyl-(pentapeptide) pyrophosphoryl-undecaprenol N-acetylglucosamine transferase [Thermomicrobiales bacterium]
MGIFSPAVAVYEVLKTREPVEVLWIGSHKEPERAAAERAGIPFAAIQTGKLRRYFDLKTVTDSARIPVGIAQAWRELRAFEPDVVFSTGGYVSVPTVVAARRIAPVVMHEQTATIGLANKINIRFADLVALTFSSSEKAARALHPNVVVTGNPVRAGLRDGDAAATRVALGFDNDLPVLYVTGGALGASPINERIFAKLPELLSTMNIIHQTGSKKDNPDFDRANQIRSGLSPELQSRYVTREFVTTELPGIFALADLVVARSGAGTVTELAHVGKPSILIPLSHAGGNEQERNATILTTAGGAVMIPESSASADRLAQEIVQLLGRPDQLAEMSDGARSVATDNAAESLATLILRHAR